MVEHREMKRVVQLSAALSPLVFYFWACNYAALSERIRGMLELRYLGLDFEQHMVVRVVQSCLQFASPSFGLLLKQVEAHLFIRVYRLYRRFGVTF